MPSPQFRKQIHQPLRPASYRAAVRRFRQLCDIIERYADPKDIREKAQLTRAIHGLAYGAKTSALDTAERQRRYKARMREMGMSEVRGIYAPRALHRQIRVAAREMVSACESLRDRQIKKV